MLPPIPHDEAARLQALRDYQVLDTPEEPVFDDLARLASRICDTPIAVITLIDEERQWFKARLGLDDRETSRDHSFCAHGLVKPTEPLVVEDARLDPRFMDNPYVQGDPKVRFYAGVPLVTPGGQALGSLCVIDQQPRNLSEDQLQMLRLLARETMTQLELRRKSLELDRLARQYRAIMDTLAEGVILRDQEGRIQAFNPSAEQLLGAPLGPSVGSALLEGVRCVREDGSPMDQSELPSFDTLRSGQDHRGVVFGVQLQGRTRWLEANTRLILDPERGSPAGAVISFWDHSERKRVEDQLRVEATHDGLTGLPNRRALEELLPRAMAAAARQKRPLCLCACDLDRFKELNDASGHAAGDEMLKLFAASLREILREEDFPVRQGGDEFCILFEGTPAEEAARSAERVRSAFASRQDPVRVTATFGLADWRPGMGPADLQAAADEALYRAKAHGRDCVKVFRS